jgi:hypothetical protein
MADYSKERGQPATGVCRQPQASYWLVFDGSHLRLQFGSRVIQRWEARSGGKLRKKSFDYSVESQKRVSLGPIPAGEYWIDPGELATQPGQYEFWRKEWPIEGWGRYRITIHTRPSTETYGRGGFFIHGGAAWGSAGCIDLTWGMESFASRLRSVKNCHIPLTVRYSVELVAEPEVL